MPDRSITSSFLQERSEGRRAASTASSVRAYSPRVQAGARSVLGGRSLSREAWGTSNHPSRYQKQPTGRRAKCLLPAGRAGLRQVGSISNKLGRKSALAAGSAASGGQRLEKTAPSGNSAGVACVVPSRSGVCDRQEEGPSRYQLGGPMSVCLPQNSGLNDSDKKRAVQGPKQASPFRLTHV